MTAVSRSRKRPPRPGEGKPPFVPTKTDRDIVGVMAACGVPLWRISSCILNPATQQPISVETLQKHFNRELEAGQAQTDLILATALVAGMKAGDHFYMSLYARNRLGWDRPNAVTMALPQSGEPDDDKIEIVLPHLAIERRQLRLCRCIARMRDLVGNRLKQAPPPPPGSS